MAQLNNTQFGFSWGPLEITRACDDDKKGWVLLLLKTKKYPNGIQVYATKSGKIRFHDYKTGEEFLKPPTPPSK